MALGLVREEAQSQLAATQTRGDRSAAHRGWVDGRVLESAQAILGIVPFTYRDLRLRRCGRIGRRGGPKRSTARAKGVSPRLPTGTARLRSNVVATPAEAGKEEVEFGTWKLRVHHALGAPHHLRTHQTVQELPLRLHYQRMRELQVLGHRDAILRRVRTPRSVERWSRVRLSSRPAPEMNQLVPLAARRANSLGRTKRLSAHCGAQGERFACNGSVTLSRHPASTSQSAVHSRFGRALLSTRGAESPF